MLSFVIFVLLCQSLNVASVDRRVLLGEPDPNDLAQALLHLQAEFQALKETTEQLRNTVTTLESSRGGGATFIRWGRTDCPANISDLVYSGYMGGSHYTHSGAAVNYVCLPKDPSWGPHKNANDDSGFMYGTEYEDHDFFGKNSRDDEAPCAVCRSRTYLSTIMIPGRISCYHGWTEAYVGDLASGYYGSTAASEYICLDQDSESLVGGGTTNENGKLLFGVRTQCGSLRCPPYENNKFMACVVCLK